MAVSGITYCYIGIIALPKQFSYKPASPKKRFQNIQTAGGTVLHAAPAIRDGDMLIPWSIKGGSKADYVQMLGYYTSYDVTDLPEERSFNGYWGDSYEVRFLEIDPPLVYGGGLYDISGSFHVTTVNTYVT